MSNFLMFNTTHNNANKHNHKPLLLAGPVVPEPCDSLLDTESEEGSVVGGRAGGGSASDFSDRFSLRVLRTTIMSSWQSSSCWEQTQFFDNTAIMYLSWDQISEHTKTHKDGQITELLSNSSHILMEPNP